MKKSLCALLLVLIFLNGCAAAPKAADSVEACEPEMAENFAPDMADEAAMYSVERSAEYGTGASSADYVDTPLVYVTFSQYLDSFAADDGTKLFTGLCYVPKFKTDDAGLDHWLSSCVEEAANRTMDDLAWTRERAQGDYPDREEGMFYAYSYYSNVNTERLDNEIISVLQVNSTYSGGAHPNYAQFAYNLDLSSRRHLTLSDVIEPGGEAVLLECVLDELKSRFDGLEGLGLFPDYRQVVEDCFTGPELTNNWYFGDHGLVIYFNCYEIAPYAAGIIKVEFGYDMLQGVLRSDYLPVSVWAGEGSVILMDSPEEREILPVPSDGELFYIGTDQVIYDVRIQRLSSWLAEGVPIVGPMIFAANRLTCADAVELGSTAAYGEASYLISFRDGSGQRRIVAFGPAAMREIVSETAK